MNTSVRREFEAQFESKFGIGFNGGLIDATVQEVALWAARWMAEHVIRNTQRHFKTETEYYLFADKVRQLAKELYES